MNLGLVGYRGMDHIYPLIFIYLILQTLEARNCRSEDDIHLFGVNCDFICHCKNNDKCDVTSGECVSGCARGWFGPGCQYRDLAAHGRVQEIRKNAGFATDGDLTTCSDIETSYKIQFNATEIITEIHIVTKSDKLLTVEHKETNRECYRHGNLAPKSEQIILFCYHRLIGNQVTIQLKRSQKQVLCDLKINGGRNLAFKRNASQISVNSHCANSCTAEKAVDGHGGILSWNQCSFTGSEDNPWWKVDLGYEARIQKIQIVTGAGERPNAIEVLNITHISEMDHNDVEDVGLNVIGRFIKLARRESNKRIMICELYVYGDCLENMCGYDCKKTCHCQKASILDKIYGNCLNGCKDGWRGSQCDIPCTAGTYGTNCEERCSKQCKGRARTCNHITGHCLLGCTRGWTGQLCKDVCTHGTYGFNCAGKCNKHCPNGCNIIDGKCLSGCVAGRTGLKCDQECEKGKYGRNCAESCSNYCYNGCNKIDGTCLSGCVAGRKGKMCQQECIDGTYGLNCEGKCSEYCLNGCNITDGKCLSGCVAGRKGLKCDQVCTHGTYGLNCAGKCNEHCLNGCNIIDGKCLSGCVAGRKGLKCDQECEKGKYGRNCAESCSNYCYNGCSRIDRTCLSGCVAGRKGKMCQQECMNGTFGLNCARKCSEQCLNGCNIVDGVCLSDCVAGRKGLKCDQECEKGKYGKNCTESCSNYCYNGCNKIDGTCLSGCVAGRKGKMCQQGCALGEYGQNCSNLCNSNCLYGFKQCDRISGQCVQGCKAGWKGPMCYQGCAFGEYGQNCSNTCSRNCIFEYKQCDRVSGQCVQGCKAGWKGPMCDQVILRRTGTVQVAERIPLSFIQCLSHQAASTETIWGLISAISSLRLSKNEVEETNDKLLLHVSPPSTFEVEDRKPGYIVGEITILYDEYEIFVSAPYVFRVFALNGEGRRDVILPVYRVFEKKP